MFKNLISALAAIFAGAGPVAAQDRAVDPAKAAVLASPGPYEVRLEKSHMVPMRDGVRLSTDLYFPTGSGPHPVLLVRTPYSKAETKQGVLARYFSSNGYVVAIQDVRGKFESDGVYTVSGGSRTDGYDTVSWLSKKPWATGAVGTYGCSYLGENQYMLLAERHPAHKTAIVSAGGGGIGSAAGMYSAFGDHHDARMLAALVGWFRDNGQKFGPKLDSKLPRSVFIDAAKYAQFALNLPKVDDWTALYMSLPVIDILKKAGSPPTDYEAFVSHGPTDPWWDERGYVTDGDRFAAPVLHVNSWFDYGTASTLAAAGLMRRHGVTELGRQNQKVIISPSTHCASETIAADEMIGERTFGDPRFEYLQTYLAWFDRWLKSMPNSTSQMPNYRYYLMGANRWQTSTQWPPAGTRETVLYLDSRKGANSRYGDGRLVPSPPVEAAFDKFTYDPANPVHTLGGPDCCWASGAMEKGAGAYEQTANEIRNDVLVFTSDVLASPVTVVGRVNAELFISSSVKDTDILVKLVDVDQAGKAWNVADKMFRLRHRDGMDRQVLMQPGQLYRVNVLLPDVAMQFNRGHRIRIQVTSSSFPSYTRNLNTGGDNARDAHWEIAMNRVHHGGISASSLKFQVLPAAAQ